MIYLLKPSIMLLDGLFFICILNFKTLIRVDRCFDMIFMSNLSSGQPNLTKPKETYSCMKFDLT